MSELLQKQFLFARDLGGLLAHANVLGFKVTVGEVSRSDEQAEINALGFSGRKQLAQLIERQFPLLAKKIANNRGNGIRNSVHCQRLAVDLQLFTPDGKWIQEVYAYQLLGEWWEAQGPDHHWGGRWGDTPHYSIEHEGAK
jgi:hypothetical protein